MNLKDKISKLDQEKQKLNSILEAFPDVEEVLLRWKSVFVSPSINPIVKEWYTAKSCGCCPDPVIYLMPYVKINDEYVYSKPPQITIGEYKYNLDPDLDSDSDLYNYDYIPYYYDNIYEKLSEYNFPEEFKQRVCKTYRSKIDLNVEDEVTDDNEKSFKLSSE